MSIDSEKRKILKELGGKDDKRKVVRTATFDDLVDLVEVEEKVRFLLADGTLLSEREIDDVVYKPPTQENVAFGIPSYNSIYIEYNKHNYRGNSSDSNDNQTKRKGLPQHINETECPEDAKLFQDIIGYIKDSSELPDEGLYVLCAAWVVHTHIIERFNFSPIFFFGGLPEKGKSRAARAMILPSRRGITKASTSDAQLIREATDHKAAIFFDMMDFWDSIEKTGSRDVILSRFQRGLKVSRVKYPEKGAFEDMVYYSVFGPTVIASNEPIHTILDTRAISVIMRQSKKEFNNEVSYKVGSKLRERLVAWRWAHFDQEPPIIPKIATGRFGDIIRPLHQIIKMVDPTQEDIFIKQMKTLVEERSDFKIDSIEAEVMQAVLDSEENVEQGKLLVGDITTTLNVERGDSEKIKSTSIGRKLKMMGFYPTRTAGGKRAIYWNSKLNDMLTLEFGQKGLSTRQVLPVVPTVTNDKEIEPKPEKGEETWTEPPTV